ncbi:Hok/Gef family protein [Providencia manganoxydans]|uniref:Type I toxin-antitoxin system Hok family toxin n=1 Tax=Providencia stuartii TaxID=588 RepID=A0AAI9D7X6_PROST|nr:type I toxin-antitoxin system Hok family toxin [Providencia stuartii]
MTNNLLKLVIVVCVTILCLTLLTKDRLCSVDVSSGSTVVKAVLSYEER